MTFGTQATAFYHLALDTGARKGELCGLRLKNVDLDAGTVSIVEQLVKPGPDPIFGPPKRGRARTVRLGSKTLELLRQHKKAQAELKMKNRKTYHEVGLVFAKDWDNITRAKDVLGLPLQMNNIDERQFDKIIKAAQVRRIKFHGMRHTCTTLLLKQRIPIPVVSERLGHN